LTIQLDGLHTRIGDRGMRLSGGQKQRLSIARELYKNPELLILDEATSALDAESESIIKEAIESLKGKITVIIIAHRLATIKNSDYIYVLENGSVIERGSYDELLAKGSKFKQMVELQSL
jgi:ABC-type multidrug transport system fused ATPase/permease subunit